MASGTGGPQGSTVTFGTDVTDWVKATQARMETVFRESVQRVVTEMQTPVAMGGNMPVDTGFLRASLQMTVNAPTGINPKARPADGKAYAYNPDSVALVIAGASIGDHLFASYSASYSLHVHFGTSKKAGRQWVTLAAQRWSSIVAAVCAETQTAVEAAKAAKPTQEL